MNPAFSRLQVLVIPILVWVLGCARTPPPEEEVHAAPVKAVPARVNNIEERTELFGTTQPLPGHSARISAAVEGQVLWVLNPTSATSVVEGQRVQKGQPIVQLVDRLARADLEHGRANLREAQALTNQARRSFELANLEVNKLTPLSTGREASEYQKEKAALAAQEAASRVEAARAKEEVTKSDLKKLEEQLTLYTLVAPISGRLGLVQALPGQTLAIGTAVADIVDLDELDVLGFAPPSLVHRLALGQLARVYAGPEHESEAQEVTQGRVVFIGVQANADNGLFPVKIRFANPKQKFRANTVAHANIVTRTVANKPTIPETALVEDTDPPGVVVVHGIETKKNKDGKEEKFGKVSRLRAILGARDRERHIVELLALEDPEKKDKITRQDYLFVFEGGQGLQNDDLVKLEEESKD